MRIAILVAAIVAITASSAHADTIFDRLRDDSGEVAGLPGWKLQRKPDKNHCGGIAIVTTRGKKKLTADEQPTANVFALTFPNGLNFSPDEKHRKTREASMKRFNDFVVEMTKVSAVSQKYYEATLDKEKTVEARARAAARMAQISMRVASLLARAEIPKDVRTGELASEKIEAFCDKLAEVAEPLLARAEEATAVCAAATKDAPAGWWTTVCATPAP
ncbi:MAG: hypothetical protein AB7T06_17290 [Kofleriaceae bacterium]